jgi:Xaa-Pro aminopeptidase
MRRPQFDMQMFKDRRSELARRAQGSVFILPSHPDMLRNNDVHHPYRQDSNLFYMTGWEEQESVFVFRPGQKPESVLFVRKKDLVRETWDGFRYGPEGATANFGMDKAYLVEEFDQKFVELVKGAETVYYRFNIDPAFDQRMLGLMEEMRTTARGQHNPGLHDPNELIGEMRLHKTEAEKKIMRKACEISSEAHVAVMKAIRPGMNERELHGLFVYEAFKRGAGREGYGTIVATGANACTLHYTFNDQDTKDGDLLLIDAGAEKDYYTGDITRTYPVNGKFTEPQKRVYEAVLNANKEILKMIKPGFPFAKLQERTIEMLVDSMFDLKLMSGDKKKIIENLDYKKYYPHGVGHWLGMDVHDAGSYLIKGESRMIEEGMSFTVEPGLYIPFDDKTAPAELRGIGIRIEDNIVVTKDGCENMTSKCPKEIPDLEAIIGT